MLLGSTSKGVRRKVAAGLCLAALAAMLLVAPAAHGDDPLLRLRALDEATFRRELASRFQYPPPTPPPHLADQRAAQMADAEYFSAFPPYDRSYSPKGRVRAQRLADALRIEAADLTREQFVLRVAEIAALAHNSHTALGIGALGMATPRIPLRTYLFADVLFVLRSDPSDADLLGARIDSIDGRSIESIFHLLRRYNGGLEAWRRRQLIPLLESPSLLHAAGIARASDQVAISGVMSNGVRFERTIAAKEGASRAATGLTQRLLYPGLASEAGMTSFLRDREALPPSLRGGAHFLGSEPIGGKGRYVRLDLIVDVDRPILPFVAEELEQVRLEHPRFVVLDLRMNTGGDATKTYQFARSLPAAASGARIYVLTSPWTRSAAMATAAVLKEQGGRQVALVGEDVGDRLDFWSEGGSFRLPNTGISVDCAAGRHVFNGRCRDLDQCFWLDFFYPTQVRSLAPVIRVPWTFAAYRQGRDPALEAVLKAEGNECRSAVRLRRPEAR